MVGLFVLALGLASVHLPVVAIDAGHGGGQEGAMGICGVPEKTLTLALAQRVAEILAASNRAVPLLTRDDDSTLGLGERADLANSAGAALLLSIHANASTNPAAHGIETFFLSNRSADGRLARLARRENDGVLPASPSRGSRDLQLILDGLTLDAAHNESQAFAMTTQQVLSEHLHARGRGVLQAPFMVLWTARMAAVLVEVGFLSNPQECRRLADATHREVIARALATAVLAHLMAFDPAVDARNLASGDAPP